MIRTSALPRHRREHHLDGPPRALCSVPQKRNCLDFLCPRHMPTNYAKVSAKHKASQ